MSLSAVKKIQGLQFSACGGRVVTKVKIRLKLSDFIDGASNKVYIHIYRPVLKSLTQYTGMPEKEC